MVALVLTSGFLFVSIRLAVIQWVQYGKWHSLAKRQHERKISDHVERGTIYDKSGKIVSINVDVPSLYAVADEVSNPQRTARLLASYLTIPQDKLVKKLNRGKDFIWLARKVNPDRLDQIKRLDLAGIGSLMESKRFYPKRALFGHIVGFVGIDNKGLEGIEHRYDEWLTGSPGEVVVVRDAYGKSIYPKGFNYIPPSRGKDLHLTLDETIQHITSRELRVAVAKARAKGGVAIVMEPDTGAILSMAVHPAFNPNAYDRYRPSEWRNKAITDMYEPGSTFKIVAASGALEESLVYPNQMINCEQGAYTVAGTVIHDHEPIGVVPFYDVIARSSNIGMVKVADRLGKGRMAAYAKAFGFGSRRGIDLTGESPGLLQETAKWSKRSLASIAIGQEVGVTPLQMAVALSVIANGGWRVTPYVVQEGAEASSFPAKKRVISEKTAFAMTRMLKRVVSETGTGGKAAIAGFSVAGKTGTAQKVDTETGRYSRNGYVSSFVGFVPASDPVLTILVMIDEPEVGEFGGEVAAPAFSIIGREVLHYLKVPPTSHNGGPI
jgi:cell division protein FtsI (penicillin-binding protein 3)